MSERGIALLLALGVVAIVAAVAADGADDEALLLREVEAFTMQAKARGAVLSGLELAVWGLRADAERDGAAPVDHLEEEWALPAPPFPVDEGTVQGWITDAQGCYNLNNLVDAKGQVRLAEVQVLRRLFRLLELDASLVDAIVDWLDADDVPFGPGGAEDASYIARGLHAKNGPLDRFRELALIEGFTPEILAKLQGVACVLPGRTAAPTPVNLNTAPLVVVRAFFPALSAAGAEAWAAGRPFARVADALAAPWARGANPARFSVNTHWFFVRVRAHYGESEMAWRYLVRRNGRTLALVAVEPLS